MTVSILEEVAAAVENLRGEVRDLRAELDALRADVDGIKDERAAEAAAKEAELGPETLVMLAAAVTSYLGKRVRIRSAKRVDTAREGAPAWARHGRAAIQTSHRLNRGR